MLLHSHKLCKEVIFLGKKGNHQRGFRVTPAITAGLPDVGKRRLVDVWNVNRVDYYPRDGEEDSREDEEEAVKRGVEDVGT